MRIGVITVLYQDLPFEAMLDKVVSVGVTAVEIGTGGYPGSHHCPVDELLASEVKRERYLEARTQRWPRSRTSYFEKASDWPIS
jgi:sugar phosphate isomerase/epimerase